MDMGNEKIDLRQPCPRCGKIYPIFAEVWHTDWEKQESICKSCYEMEQTLLKQGIGI